MNILDQLSFSQLLWLVPILLAIHNLEESLFMGRWLKSTELRFRYSVSAPQFVVATTLLTIGGFAITFFAVSGTQTGSWLYMVAAIQAILFINAFAPHIIATIWYRKYHPGVVTGVLLNIPFSMYFFNRAISNGILSQNDLLLIALISPFAMLALAGGALMLGKAILAWIDG